MLNIRVGIERIDYEQSIGNLLPSVVASFEKKEMPGELEKFLIKLGSDAVPVTKKLLSFMETDVMDGIIVWLLTSHEPRLRAALNERLESILPDKAIQIGYLAAENHTGSQLALCASAVKIDYAALLGSPLVAGGMEKLENSLMRGAAKTAVQIGAKLPSDWLEKQGAALIGSEKIKAKLLSAITDAVRQIGLCVELRDMVLETGQVIRLPETLAGAKDEGMIPDAFEDALMDAVVSWLKDTV